MIKVFETSSSVHIFKNRKIVDNNSRWHDLGMRFGNKFKIASSNGWNCLMLPNAPWMNPNMSVQLCAYIIVVANGELLHVMSNIRLKIAFSTKFASAWEANWGKQSMLKSDSYLRWSWEESYYVFLSGITVHCSHTQILYWYWFELNWVHGGEAK